MADVSITQKLKLTNSRKRFKELQELKKSKNTCNNSKLSVENISNNIPVDSKNSVDSCTVEQIQENNSDLIMQLPKYFDNIQCENQTPAVFFDSYGQDSARRTKKDIDDVDISNIFNDVNPLPIQNITQSIIPDVDCSSNTKGHETKPEKYFVQDNYSEFPQGTHDVVETQQVMYPSEDIVKTPPKIMNQEIICDLQNAKDQMKSETSENENLTAKKEIAFSGQDKVRVQHSSVESLLQLSRQMAHLVEPDCTSSSITDLEKRNLELATLLEQEKIKTEHQNSIINGLENKLSLIGVGRDEDEICNVHAIREKNRLNEELQYHIQTVGMLVAEKAELSANISKFELTSVQKFAECEQLQTLLKASRSHIIELEKEINNLQYEKKQNNKAMKDQSEIITKLEQECSSLRNQNEEVMQEILEIREKLNSSNEENVTLQKHNLQFSSKLSLANIKIQQLTAGEQLQDANQLEKVTEEKMELKRHVSSLNQMLQSITKERDESSLQYQQYAQQQSAQLAILSSKIEQLQIENENLSTQEQNRIQHITELEKQLQNLQSEGVTYITNKNSDCILKTDLDNTREHCVQLQIEKINLEENYLKVTNEKEMLLKELKTKNDSILQFEDMVEQLRGNQPDSVKLLAAIESDKVAAARAVQQNKVLKQQAESMEEVLLKLNNDKIELTEQLSMELKTNKELLEKLQKTELQLQRLNDAIEIKDRELLHLKEMYSNLNKDIQQPEQLSNISRQYETQENSSKILQNQLQDAEHSVEILTDDIYSLKHSHINSMHPELKFQNADASGPLFNKNNNITNYLQNDNDKFEKEIYMKHLEEKFTRTMQDIANLTEERQRLDHLVLQLQGETETIGEYVALYQHQRMILKQKTHEKDQQLKQLSIDREEMKLKLDKLNKLLRKLLLECSIASSVRQPQNQLTTETSQDIECDKELHTATEVCKTNDNILMERCLNPPDIGNEILMLLSDINSSNLVQNNEDICHCPCCSGQLMIV